MPEVKVPELAESITEGTIAEWLKQVGDSVEKGEAIVELETDKVNVEVVSEEAGVIQEQLANEGDTVEVGQAIAVVGEGSGTQMAAQQMMRLNKKKLNKKQVMRMINQMRNHLNKMHLHLQIKTHTNVSMLHHLRVNMPVKKALIYQK